MIELLNIDCMEYMATLPDKAFDLAVVDPPYGVNIGSKVAERERERDVPLAAVNRLVKVGGEKLSSPKFIGDLMTPESPNKNILRS
jgi:DNA modification methylase